mmetsp:Transcript_14653/g.34779  ORF Transcript_14653/g.34779 Transcript_14653/m.34779 type:complete len:95 (-) Transcript_14653:200-484(-)
MASDTKARKRTSGSAGKEEQTDIQGAVWRIGRFRINLGRIPELLMLILLAIVISLVGVASFQMSRQMAVMTGLFCAVQVQRAGNWLRDWVAYKT